MTWLMARSGLTRRTLLGSWFKLCRSGLFSLARRAEGGIPYLNTYDGSIIRYPDPLIKANDTIKIDLETNKIVDFIKFDVGAVVTVTGGRNTGRVGVIKNREKHKGSFETIHVEDALGHQFATRLGKVFTIRKGNKPWVNLPNGKGIITDYGPLCCSSYNFWNSYSYESLQKEIN